MKYIGLDAGSVSVKLVVIDDTGSLLHRSYQRHRGQPLPLVLELLKTVQCATFNVQPDELSLSLTGSAGRLLGSILSIEPVNEVVAYAYATRSLYPHIRTIIELGGEDSKLITLGEDSLSAKDFAMNSVCAAGTGSFLDQQAERLMLSIEEFSELSLKSEKPPRIAGRCSVFAKSDMIHLQQIATPVEDIVAGLCFAVARNFKGSIARGRELSLPVSFQGGVAANRGMVRAFREIFNLDELFVPPEHAIMGAIGAAFKDRDAGRRNSFDLGALERFLREAKPTEEGYRPLIRIHDDFLERHGEESSKFGVQSSKSEKNIERRTSNVERAKAYLGVDIGSISTNLVVIDDDCHLLAKRYLMTAGRPIEAVRQGLEEIGREVGDRVDIMGVGTTGSGRYMIADYIGADIVRNEITAQATAAAFLDREVDTIFEIGGQDSKYISLRDGVIVDFEMNKACAAGTGSFLEEQAEKLDISIKGEFADMAFASSSPCRLGERCTVFMENSLMANLQKGTEKEDLLAGLAYSIVQNYINRVVCKRHVGERIFFQGGVAFNKSVVAAFEKYLGRQITVPPHHEVTGAIGMALIAREHMNSEKGKVKSEKSEEHSLSASPINDSALAITNFKGFGLSKQSYAVSSFACRGCSNVCEINRVKIAGEDGNLFYGGRCEKYDVGKKQKDHGLPDLFAYREEMLWKAHESYRAKGMGQEAKGKGQWPASGIRKEGEEEIREAPETQNSDKKKIGIPYIFYFQDYLPFWTTLLWELGFEVIVSPKTERSIIDRGLESVLSETCFPVKTAFGHIRYLLEQEVDALFIPSFVNLNKPEAKMDRGYACPYTQTIPYAARVAFPGAKILTPIVNLRRGGDFLRKELGRTLKPFGIRPGQLRHSLSAAHKAQEDFQAAVREKGRETLDGLKERSLVIVGRAYNSFDRGVNLNIPKKLADLGVLAIPMDFLPVEDPDITEDWPNMYWRAGQRILTAARIIREHALLFPVYIGNFSCGPDSFIIKFFEDDLQGKPYLHIEIDEHSADAGAITRCEAFLDSIQNHVRTRKTEGRRGGIFQAAVREKIVYVPRMSDHAVALAAAFQYCGLRAEVLPESTRKTVDLGRKYVSGKECYPCAVTTGDMVSKVTEPGFEPGRAAFFMPSGSGPCRFGQYNVFHRLVLKEMGLEDIPVFSPNQDQHFYRHLGIVGKDFSMRSWQGIIAVELLQKCLHETRPYEKEKGVADSLYRDYLGRVSQSVSGTDGNLQDVLRKARADFGHLPRHEGRRPRIGIVGEIFVRSNRFSNEDLVRKIESLGGEAYLSPVEEWIYYVNAMGLRRVLINRDWSGMINLLLKMFFQKRVEHRFGKIFEGFLRTLHEPGTGDLLKNAGPYVDPSFEGEAILSIGKSIDLIGKGVAGIVNAMPFGCMPGTIVSGLMRGLNREFGIPCLSIPYDGTESLTMTIQLEAFMDQAREHGKRKRER